MGGSIWWTNHVISVSRSIPMIRRSIGAISARRHIINSTTLSLSFEERRKYSDSSEVRKVAALLLCLRTSKFLRCIKPEKYREKNNTFGPVIADSICSSTPIRRCHPYTSSFAAAVRAFKRRFSFDAYNAAPRVARRGRRPIHLDYSPTIRRCR